VPPKIGQPQPPSFSLLLVENGVRLLRSCAGWAANADMTHLSVPVVEKWYDLALAMMAAGSLLERVRSVDQRRPDPIARRSTS